MKQTSKTDSDLVKKYPLYTGARYKGEYVECKYIGVISGKHCFDISNDDFEDMVHADKLTDFLI